MSTKSTIPIDADVVRQDGVSAHEAWFRAEVQAGLREADAPNAVWVTQDEVDQQSAQRRIAWQAKIDLQRKSA